MFAQLSQAFANDSRPKKVNNSSKKSRRMQRRRARRLISSYAEGGEGTSAHNHMSRVLKPTTLTLRKNFKKKKNFLLEDTTEASAPPFPLRNMQPWLETQTSD